MNDELFPKKKKRKLRAGDPVIYIIPEKRFKGTVLERNGKVVMVQLEEPRCVCQVLRSSLKRVRP